jgi:hypothetical protein
MWAFAALLLRGNSQGGGHEARPPRPEAPFAASKGPRRTLQRACSPTAALLGAAANAHSGTPFEASCSAGGASGRGRWGRRSESRQWGWELRGGPTVAINPLKGLELTEGRHLDFLPLGLDFLPLGLDFLPLDLDFLPSGLEFLPSGLEIVPSGLASRRALGSPHRCGRRRQAWELRGDRKRRHKSLKRHVLTPGQICRRGR